MRGVRLSVAIQHHPSRPDLPKRLRAALRRSSATVEVVTDPDPTGPRNPWRTAQLAWSRTPASCTHRLVLQDDVLPCRDFLKHAGRALSAKPDRVASFYLGTNAIVSWQRMLVAAPTCAAWVEGFSASWVPALALALPAELALDLAAFHDGTEPIADDEVYGRWCREQGLPWYATIPSLVDHDDDAPSLMRDPYARGDRRAACWIGDTDPGLIDWTRD